MPLENEKSRSQNVEVIDPSEHLIRRNFRAFLRRTSICANLRENFYEYNNKQDIIGQDQNCDINGDQEISFRITRWSRRIISTNILT